MKKPIDGSEDILNVVSEAIVNLRFENDKLKKGISLCPHCSKSNICSAHRNYGIEAIKCMKYKERKK